MTKKARTGGKARLVVHAALGAEDSFGGGAYAYGYYTPERADQVIAAARPGHSKGDHESRRFRQLRRELGVAAQNLLFPRRPTHAERLAALLEIAATANRLSGMIDAVHNGWNPWWEIQSVLRHAHPEGMKCTPETYESYRRSVASVADLAESARLQMACQERPDDERDALDSYFEALALAYENYFGKPAGFSTDSGRGIKRDGPFVRFAITAAALIDLELTGEQVKKRLERQGPKKAG